jgi:hypothetical protein
VTQPEPPSLPALIRHWLGTDRIPYLEEAVNNAKTQLDGLKTDLSDFTSDLDAKLTQFIEAQGDLKPDAQAVFDEIKASVASLDEKVGDADGSDTVVPPPAEENPTV